MFQLFKSATFSDAVLGELARRRKYWRGVITLGTYAEVPLALAGDRSAPDAAALAAASTAPDIL